MTIFRKVTPMPDENLAGLVARAAGANIYPHARDVLVQAKLDHVRPQAIATHGNEGIDALARVLGTSPESLKPLFHSQLSSSSIDFFGTELRSLYRERTKRRVSPRALAEAPYIKAIWSVRPLAFDPGTKELLIDSCPVCERALGFSITWGVEFCEHCIGSDEYGLPRSVTDLREFPQPIVEVADEEALDFATSLIDPGNAASKNLKLHADLAGLNRSELFDLAVAIGSALLQNERSSESLSWGTRNRAGVRTLPPEHLATATRAILSWPHAFVAMCAAEQAHSSRRTGEWGMFKEFGALANLVRDDNLTPAAKAVVNTGIDKALSDIRPGTNVPRKTTRPLKPGNYIGVGQILKLVPISSRITKRLGDHPDIRTYRFSDEAMSPVFFETWQAAGVVGHYLDLASEARIGTTFGLPPDGVRDLVSHYIDSHSGDFQKVAEDIAGGGTFHSKHDLNDLVDILREGLPVKKRPRDFISFTEAMLMFPSGHRPWLPMMNAIFHGHVDAIFHREIDETNPKNLLASISVRRVEYARELIMFDHSYRVRHDIKTVSAVAVSQMLGFHNHYVFVACIDAGLIEVDDEGAALYSSVLEFAARYIFANEVAVRSRNTPQEVPRWLEDKHVFPAREFPVKGGVIYERAKVEPWLEMRV